MVKHCALTISAEARAIAYADDGYIKAKLSIALQVLAELKAVFKADAGLELNVVKTSILPKGVTTQAVFDMTQTIMQATTSLAHLRNDFHVDSFCPEGFIGIGVPIGTDAFVQSFVAKKCRDIIDDVEKLETQDGGDHVVPCNVTEVSRGRIPITVYPTCLHGQIKITTSCGLTVLIRCSSLGVSLCLGSRETKVLVRSRW